MYIVECRKQKDVQNNKHDASQQEHLTGLRLRRFKESSDFHFENWQYFIFFYVRIPLTFLSSLVVHDNVDVRSFSLSPYLSSTYYPNLLLCFADDFHITAR